MGSHMGFADVLAQETIRPAAGKLERILTALSPQDRAAVQEAIANEAIPVAAITRALKKLGHDIGDERIRKARMATRD